MGSILTENNSHLFPVYNRDQIINRIKRIESNTLEVAYKLSSEKEITNLYDIIDPGLDNRPAQSLA